MALTVDEYGPLHLTWLGIYRPILRGHLVAIAPVLCDLDEVIERAAVAHSSHEHDAFRWLKLDRRTLATFLRAVPKTTPTVLGDVVVVESEQWIAQSRLALAEVWRYREIVLG